MSADMYDYIIVGGGLSGCVVASRLREYDETANILLIEAGPDTRSRPDILDMQLLNLGGDLDWQYQCEPVAGLMGKKIIYNQGKGLGGDTVINSGGWTRGGAVDYDEWADVVGDQRWSYEGQLPWMKKCERWYEEDPEQHGKDGPVNVASAFSAGRKFPLTDLIGAAWDELGVAPCCNFSQNEGENIGRACVCEGRRAGKRQTSASVYSLENIAIRTDTLAKRVILNRHADGTIQAGGVELADGTVFHSKKVISCAGAFRSPQLLMLSGIGPAKTLKKFGVETLVDLPEIPLQVTHFGSANPLFLDPKFQSGVPLDWIICSDVPKDGLAKALEKDEGALPDPLQHPLLNKPRAFNEMFVIYMNVPFDPSITMDADHLTTGVIHFRPTSRGVVSLRSANPEDTPAIQLNLLATEADRYTYREGLRQIMRLMLDTKFGREYIAGESVPEAWGLDPLSLNDSDEKLDKRIASSARTSWHAAGSCSMGKVVDSSFRVKGVEGLMVVDASVIPVPMGAHLQAPLYAMSEQASAIIAGKA